MEGYQDPVDEGGDFGTELANSVSGDKQGRAVWLNRKAKVDGCDAWTTYWLSQGMPRVWVDFWRQHNWSWDTAEVTTELREYINKEGNCSCSRLSLGVTCLKCLLSSTFSGLVLAVLSDMLTWFSLVLLAATSMLCMGVGTSHLDAVNVVLSLLSKTGGLCPLKL